jgi:hypothetical protein
MLHVVTKPLSGPEGEIPSGTLVEPTKWKNFNALVSLRHIRPITPADIDGLEEVAIDGNGISDVNVLRKASPAKPKTGLKAKKKKQ